MDYFYADHLECFLGRRFAGLNQNETGYQSNFYSKSADYGVTKTLGFALICPT